MSNEKGLVRVALNNVITPKNFIVLNSFAVL